MSRQNPTPKKRKRKRKKKWEKGFLGTLASTGNVTAAARAAGIHRSTAYELKNKDETFAVSWKDAMDEAADLLEMEARRRATQGVPEPVFYKGQKIAIVHKYSDTLLIFLLKGNRPEKYRERYQHQHEHSGEVALPVTIYIPDNGRDASN
jgi:hypothetical protein